MGEGAIRPGRWSGGLLVSTARIDSPYRLPIGYMTDDLIDYSVDALVDYSIGYL
ncbi:hypothetical protein [Streptomyces sp. NBC_00212]|uniref:hypothetical protein n=1 Tax=Streptomyces sp. NBC_00212 TaxID=2975684 RepID=UPI00324BD643